MNLRIFRSTVPKADMTEIDSVRKAIIDAERESGVVLFDQAFYRRQCPDLPAEADPLTNFLQQGWLLSLDPSSNFSTAWYLEANPDVRASGDNPFLHYLNHGRAEGRRSVPEFSIEIDKRLDYLTLAKRFDVEFYLQQNPDFATEDQDPVLHYLEIGWRQGLDPNPAFSTDHYLQANDDVRRASVNPFMHFLLFGKEEGRETRPAGVRLKRERVLEDHGNIDVDIATIRPYFDVPFYRRAVRDLPDSVDPVRHYLETGWKILLDPSPTFSTEYYLTENLDVRARGINPFVHYVVYGRRDGRHGLSFDERMRQVHRYPKVTAIVPNYNHARFLVKRIESILNQTYHNIEIIILDDCSTDESRTVIDRYAALHQDKIRTIYNHENSGNVFLQWKKGVEAAEGELIWICESDDFCEPDFIERCIEPLSDRSVMIAFGRVQFVDTQGDLLLGLDDYREAAEPGIWHTDVVRYAAEWFRGAFAVSNLIPNVGGCLIRRQLVSETVWASATNYRIVGDWYLYCALSQGGRIAYVYRAVSYFRQHGRNTSVTGFLKSYYYSEHEELASALRRMWGTPDDKVLRIYANLYRHHQQAGAGHVIGDVSQFFSNDRVLAVQRTSFHVLICSLGFRLGGGELFPIYLANELVSRGYTVSMMMLLTESENASIRTMLDARVAIYDAQMITEVGIDHFIEKAFVDLIHSHNVGIELLLLQMDNRTIDIPYVVTLHGSYEVTAIPDLTLLRMIKTVSRWIYLSSNNLKHLDAIPIAQDRLVHVANGIPRDVRPFPLGREGLGIEPDDVVFTLASRAIKDKGWHVAIAAIKIAQAKTDRTLRLLLCGTGPAADELSRLHEGPAIRFLGFQDRISGLYDVSDVVLLPTRFEGESFPLSIIQALQAGRASIATDIGQIRSILTDGEIDAGILIASNDDDEAFTEDLAKAMLVTIDDTLRRSLAENARKLASRYDIRTTVDRYVEIYECEMRRRSAHGGTADGMRSAPRPPRIGLSSAPGGL